MGKKSTEYEIKLDETTQNMYIDIPVTVRVWEQGKSIIVFGYLPDKLGMTNPRFMTIPQGSTIHEVLKHQFRIAEDQRKNSGKKKDKNKEEWKQ